MARDEIVRIGPLILTLLHHQNAIDLLHFYEKEGGVVLSDSPDGYIKVLDQDKWYLGSELDYDF